MNINVFFCDDIRAEEDGRRSYMGFYEPTFKIKGDQLLIPKFCIYAELYLDNYEDYVNAKLILRNGSEVVGEFPFIDPEQHDKLKAAKSFARIELSISPLVVNAPVVVSAALLLNGKEMIVRKVDFFSELESKDLVKRTAMKKRNISKRT